MEPNSAQRSPKIEAFNPPDAVKSLRNNCPDNGAKSPIVFPWITYHFLVESGS